MNTTKLSAQSVQKEKQSLVTILKALEEKHQVLFSYVDSTLNNITVSPLENDLTIEDALAFLRLETDLDFEVLNSRYIVIKKTKNQESSFYTQRLEEVEVVNYLTSGITKFNDGSITIEPKTFGILPGLIEPDVLHTIQALPGVLSVDETVSNINVRGGTHDQNLILWDGIKMYQSGHFFGLISAFNPYITERINVYKNGTRAKYGDGVSSIIDMQLPNTIDNEFKAGGGFNFINTDIFAKMPLSNKSELQLSARRSITDLLKTVTFENYSKRIFQDSDFEKSNNSGNSISKNESFYFYDITAKFLYDITKKDKVRLHIFNIYNDLNYDENSIINSVNETLNSKLSQRNSAIGLTYIREWNSFLSVSTQLHITNYDINATNFDILNEQRLIQENEIFDGAAKIDLNYTSNNQLKLNGGYQFSEIGISNLEDVNNPIFKSYIKEVVRTHSVYLESHLLSKSTNTQLVLGGRLNYIPKFDITLPEPRLSFSQRFLNHFRFEVLGEFKSQTTTQIIDLQNDFLGIENRRWVMANNKTEVETINSKNIYPIPITKSKQGSIGLYYNQNKLLISVESYLKRVDGITARSQGFQNQYQYVNSIGYYDVKGVDALINKQFNTKFSSWMSYSFSKNNYHFDDLNDGNPFPNNADVRHTFNVSGTYTANQLKIALGLNWHSGIPTTEPAVTDDPSDDVITYSSPNNSNLEDYLRADFSVTYNFNISEGVRADLGASIWNIFNRTNIINSYYTLSKDSSGNNSIIKVENESLGITPNISFRVTF